MLLTFFGEFFPPFFFGHLSPPLLIFFVGVFLMIFDVFGGCLGCYDLGSGGSGSSRCCGGRCFLRAVFRKMSDFVTGPT